MRHLCAGLRVLLLTNCSSIATLPTLSSLAALEVLDLENCSVLHSLPSLPDSLDLLVLSGCDHLCTVQHDQRDAAEAAPEPAAAAGHDAAVHSNGGSRGGDADSRPRESRTLQQVEDALQALPQSLTEMQVAGCPLFSGRAALAALSAFLISNRLLQWERFREPDALAPLAPE